MVEFNRVPSLGIVEAHCRASAPVELGLCDESVDDHAPAKQRRLLLSVPYQRGDSGVPLPLSKLQRSSAFISLEVDVTARSKELLCDGLKPKLGRDVERRVPILAMKIDVTACSKSAVSKQPHALLRLRSRAPCTRYYPEGRRYSELQSAAS